MPCASGKYKFFAGVNSAYIDCPKGKYST